MSSKPSVHLKSTQIAQAALRRQTIAPPPSMKLTAGERRMFDALAAEFSRTETSDHRVELMVMLARIMHSVDTAQTALSREGLMVSTPKGLVRNPLVATIKDWLGCIARLRTALGLGNYNRSLKEEGLHRAKVKEQEDAVLTTVVGDDMIGRPFLDDPMIAKPGNSRPPPKIKMNS